MTEGSSALHPAVQKLAALHRRRLRLLGLFVFFILSGILLLAMVAALTSQNLGSLLTLGLVGLLLLPALGLAGGLLWYIERTATRKLNSANQLLSDCAPQTARLVPIEALIGGHLVELILATDARLYAAFARSLHPLPRHAVEVQLYGQTRLSGGELVAFQPNGIALLGTVVEPKTAQRRNQWLKIYRWVAIIAVIITLLYQLYGPL